jgi:uncharacterized protein with ATP-grasp and redox domains
MKLTPECVPCLLKRVAYEANLIKPDMAFEVLRECCKVLSKCNAQVVSAELATEVHRKAYAVLDSNDPYADVKRLSNETALSLKERARQIISAADEPLHAAALVSIAGNVLDFGIKGAIEGPEALTQVFDGIIKAGLQKDDLMAARKYFKPDAKILYFTDNCGEIIFDDLLIRELQKLGCIVTLVVKGAPILTDATVDDVEAHGISHDELLTTGSNGVGISFNEMGDELHEALDASDLIVAKGMANYESFSDARYLPILYLMRTKCQPIATSIGEGTDASIAKLFE